MRTNYKKLSPNPNNPRTISKEAFEKLKKKIQRNPDGLSANKIVHKDGNIIAGNQRWRALQDLGMELKDEWFKDVSDWTPEQIREYLITSNISDGEWDWDVLANEWEKEELEELGLETPWNDPEEVVEDEAPEVEEEPVSELGKIYQLGKHRVMCGDSTKDIGKLMGGVKASLLVTDPPYGVSYADKNEFLNSIAPGNRNQTKIENDHMKPDEMKEFWTEAFGAIFAYLANDATYYITSPQGGELLLLLQSLYDIGYPSRHMIIWSKNNHVLGRCDYNYKHEPILYGWLEKHKFYGNGQQKSSVWNIDKPHQSKEHPTMKPIELFAECILNSTEKDQIVLDTYLGSGTTVIACEQTDRICYGMELDPKYTDVIRKRWAKFVYPDTWEERWEELTPELPESRQSNG